MPILLALATRTVLHTLSARPHTSRTRCTNKPCRSRHSSYSPKEEAPASWAAMGVKREAGTTAQHAMYCCAKRALHRLLAGATLWLGWKGSKALPHSGSKVSTQQGALHFHRRGGKGSLAGPLAFLLCLLEEEYCFQESVPTRRHAIIMLVAYMRQLTYHANGILF